MFAAAFIAHTWPHWIAVSQRFKLTLIDGASYVRGIDSVGLCLHVLVFLNGAQSARALDQDDQREIRVDRRHVHVQADSVLVRGHYLRAQNV